MRRRRREDNMEVNAGSMADIAFLLLIFFLVTTTIASDKGLSILLPPKREEDELNEFKMKDRNVFKVLVNSRNQLLVEEEPLSLDQLREAAKEFINNKGREPEMSDSPQEAAVSFKTDRGTRYDVYIRVLDEIKASYNELRAEYLGISLDEYLQFNESEAVKDDALIRKAQLFSQLAKESFTPTEYLNFDAVKRGQEGKGNLVRAYQQARASGKELFIEKYYDASREYPLRISEAEPSKIGG
ncbi:MAG: biopolymer transporter ExbD [Bacteroidia bacterium]|nr:biopolymer transporter ExbD [Bacteroidia bacterium]